MLQEKHSFPLARKIHHILFFVMPKFDDRLGSIYASNRKMWREWLEKNHSTS